MTISNRVLNSERAYVFPDALTASVSSFDDLLSNLGLPFFKTKESFIKEEVGIENYKIIEQIRKMNTKKGTQLLMPYEINIK